MDSFTYLFPTELLYSTPSATSITTLVLVSVNWLILMFLIYFELPVSGIEPTSLTELSISTTIL